MRKLIYAALIAGLYALPGAQAIEIETEYAPYLEKRLPKLDKIEQRREERFRKFAVDSLVPQLSLFVLNNSRTEGTIWAGERLIEDYKDYGFDAMLKALVRDNLERVGIQHSGTIKVRVDKFRLINSSIIALQGINTYAAGKIALLDEQGTVLKEEKIRVNFVFKPTNIRQYKGEKYAFSEPDALTRFGPLLSQFVEVGLEKLYPMHKDQIHGPFIIDKLLSGPTSVSTPGF